MLVQGVYAKAYQHHACRDGGPLRRDGKLPLSQKHT